MLCTCGAETRVVETRTRSDGSIRRRRKCTRCQDGFTTIEARVPPLPAGDAVVMILSERGVEHLRDASIVLRELFAPKTGKTQHIVEHPLIASRCDENMTGVHGFVGHDTQCIYCKKEIQR